MNSNKDDFTSIEKARNTMSDDNIKLNFILLMLTLDLWLILLSS